MSIRDTMYLHESHKIASGTFDDSASERSSQPAKTTATGIPDSEYLLALIDSRGMRGLRSGSQVSSTGCSRFVWKCGWVSGFLELKEDRPGVILRGKCNFQKRHIPPHRKPFVCRWLPPLRFCAPNGVKKLGVLETCPLILRANCSGAGRFDGNLLA